jgi:hypothetical protein
MAVGSDMVCERPTPRTKHEAVVAMFEELNWLWSLAQTIGEA